MLMKKNVNWAIFAIFFSRVRSIIYVRESRGFPVNRPEVRSEVQKFLPSTSRVDVDSDSGRIVGFSRKMAGFRRWGRFVARHCGGQKRSSGLQLWRDASSLQSKEKLLNYKFLHTPAGSVQKRGIPRVFFRCQISQNPSVFGCCRKRRKRRKTLWVFLPEGIHSGSLSEVISSIWSIIS